MLRADSKKQAIARLTLIGLALLCLWLLNRVHIHQSYPPPFTHIHEWTLLGLAAYITTVTVAAMGSLFGIGWALIRLIELAFES